MLQIVVYVLSMVILYVTDCGIWLSVVILYVTDCGIWLSMVILYVIECGICVVDGDTLCYRL